MQEFSKVNLCVGTVIEVNELPRVKKPSYQITVDFGLELGIKKSSSQIKDLYKKPDLLGRQVIGLVNIPAKQVGPLRSEFLLMGFYRKNGSVVLAVPDKPVANGSKMA